LQKGLNLVVLTHSAAPSPSIDSGPRTGSNGPAYEGGHKSAAQGQPLPTGRQAEQAPDFRPGKEVEGLTSILGCVKKITFCPHSKSKKSKFSLSFGEINPFPF
jgi:hypothetical protein